MLWYSLKNENILSHKAVTKKIFLALFSKYSTTNNNWPLSARFVCNEHVSTEPRNSLGGLLTVIAWWSLIFRLIWQQIGLIQGPISNYVYYGSHCSRNVYNPPVLRNLLHCRLRAELCILHLLPMLKQNFEINSVAFWNRKLTNHRRLYFDNFVDNFIYKPFSVNTIFCNKSLLIM